MKIPEDLKLVMEEKAKQASTERGKLCVEHIVIREFTSGFLACYEAMSATHVPKDKVLKLHKSAQTLLNNYLKDVQYPENIVFSSRIVDDLREATIEMDAEFEAETNGVRR